MRNREKGTIRLILDLNGWAYLTKESITTESNQGAFVNQVRQKIKKSRLEAITQLNGEKQLTESLFEAIFGDGNRLLEYQ